MNCYDLLGKISLVIGDSKSSIVNFIENLESFIDDEITVGYHQYNLLNKNSNRGRRNRIYVVTLPYIGKLTKNLYKVLDELYDDMSIRNIGLLLLVRNDLDIIKSNNSNIYISKPNGEYINNFPKELLNKSDYIFYCKELDDGILSIDPIKFEKGIRTNGVLNIENGKKIIYTYVESDPYNRSFMYQINSNEISYDPLWATLKTLGIENDDFRKMCKITSITLDKLLNNKDVSMTILKKICKYLDCQFSDIMVYSPIHGSIK